MINNVIDATDRFTVRGQTERVRVVGTREASIIELPLEKAHHKGALKGIVEALLILLDRGDNGTANCIELTELYDEQLNYGLPAHEILDILLDRVALIDEAAYDAYVPHYPTAFESLL
jgi:hypothetical protein